MKLTKISDIFEISYGNGFELNRLKICSDKDESAINFVSRTAKNNGVAAKVKPLVNVEPFESGLITVAVSGSVLETFLQPEPFYTAYHIMVLRPKRKMSESEKMFYCLAIRENRYRYNYGRQANRSLKDIKIPEDVPVWIYKISLEDFDDIENPYSSKKVSLFERKWSWFRYDELFEIERGRGARVSEVKENGQVRFVTSTDQNNGLKGFVDTSPAHNGNVISVNRNGSVGEAFYQPKPFCSTEDVHIFVPKFDLNPFLAMFLITLIKKEKYRFSYGRKWGIGRMKVSLIKLPITESKKPDWNFMESYIKSLPYSSQLAET